MDSPRNRTFSQRTGYIGIIPTDIHCKMLDDRQMLFTRSYFYATISRSIAFIKSKPTLSPWISYVYVYIYTFDRETINRPRLTKLGPVRERKRRERERWTRCKKKGKGEENWGMKSICTYIYIYIYVYIQGSKDVV